MDCKAGAIKSTATT